MSFIVLEIPKNYKPAEGKFLNQSVIQQNEAGPQPGYWTAEALRTASEMGQPRASGGGELSLTDAKPSAGIAVQGHACLAFR